MNRILAALPLLLIAAACARSEDPTFVQVDANKGYSQSGRVSAPEQDDQEPAIGQWRQSLQDNVPALEFGPIGTQPLFSLLCTGRQSVLLQRHGGAPSGPLPELRLAVAGREASLPVSPSGGSIPMLRADVPLNHPIVQALAQGGQPLTMRFGEGAAPVIIPVNAAVGDYLRSCTTAAPLPATAGNGAAPVANGAAPAAAPVANGAAPLANTAAPAAPANAARNRP